MHSKMEMPVEDFASQAIVSRLIVGRTIVSRSMVRWRCLSKTSHRRFTHLLTMKLPCTNCVLASPSSSRDAANLLTMHLPGQPTYHALTRPTYLPCPCTYQANLQQRRGRAGRVRTGLAIHLVTSHRLSMYAKLLVSSN